MGDGDGFQILHVSQPIFCQDSFLSLTHSTNSDGLRVDSAKHVETSFWSGFSDAAGVYLLGEVFQGDPLYVAPYQQYFDGVTDYPR